MTLPTIITAAGMQPRSPEEIRAALVALVQASNPGFTADLPASLIEDIVSTDVAAISLCESARIELVDSLTPFAANAYLLNQLGTIYGVSLGAASNTSVYVVFTGTPGFVIAQGFTISDGTHQYTVQDGGIVGSGGDSAQLFCVAVESGAWAVPVNTVTTLITSVPGAITLSVTNPAAGLPAESAESEEEYRARVLQAGLSPATGMATYLKTLLTAVPGVQARLISVVQQTSGWSVIVGGGDPYDVAYAIYTALFDISLLVGSVMSITGITQANPGVVTTLLNHGLTTGGTTTISGVLGMTAANGGPYTVTVITEKTFSFGVNTSGFGAYTSGGILTPNTRNITASITDYPDSYDVVFINPPQQSVVVQLTWNTTSPYSVSASAVAQLGAPAIADYVNSIPVGAPINVFEMQNVFVAAVSSLISPPFLTRMVFTVSINGVSTAPTAGTGIIPGDPESYFQTSSASVTITQG